ncbi:hypothetical protein H7X69_00870 [Candidatus Saccharibacteria bacterium]|nr:hypothetical protein [Candidatus Saccharibacteria bacterium]
MSRFVEKIADQGDTAIARFSEKHLPQSDEAIAKRAHIRKIIGGATLAGVLIGGGIGLTNELFEAADQQVRHEQTVNDDAKYNQLVDRSVELPTLPSPEK